MLFPTAEQWHSWGVESDLHKLFLLLWVELFDTTTLDTWQVRTSNVRTILQEVLHTVDVAEDHAAFGHNVHELIAEADIAAELDPVVSRHYPHLRAYLKPLVDSEESRKKLDLVRSRVAVLVGHLCSYREHLIADLKAALREPTGKEKEQLVRLTMGLGTELSASGYSTQFLRQGVAVLQESGRDFSDRVDSMLRKFSGGKRRYTCTFLVFAPPLLLTLSARDVRFTRGKPPPPHSAEREAFYAQAAESDLFATVEVEALDPVSARTLAQERLANTFAAIVAFEYEKNFGVKGALVLVGSPAEPEQVLAVGGLPRVHYSSAAKPLERASELLELAAGLATSDVEQLNAALQYHRLALAAATDEVRLVNLWIALEGLVRRGRGTSIIDRVCSHIAPTIAMSNTMKLLRGLAIYIREYWKAHRFEPFQEVFPTSTAKRLRPSDLVEVLLDVKDGPLITKLYDLVDHPLIRYRIFKARKGLGSADRIARNLQHHRRNIDWQLRRIYRARNEVIHRASCPPATPLLLEHLHTYFIGTIHAVLHNLRTSGRAWSIPDALEHRTLLFDHYVQYLKSPAAKSMSRPALFDPALILQEQEGPVAWLGEPTEPVKSAPK